MLGYRFALGDIVNFRSRSLGMRDVPDSFEIMALLPRRDGVAQYRVRSESERHERVVLEDDIECVRSFPANSNVPEHLRER
jgi:hypothetical protein